MLAGLSFTESCPAADPLSREAPPTLACLQGLALPGNPEVQGSMLPGSSRTNTVQGCDASTPNLHHSANTLNPVAHVFKNGKAKMGSLPVKQSIHSSPDLGMHGFWHLQGHPFVLNVVNRALELPQGHFTHRDTVHHAQPLPCIHFFCSIWRRHWLCRAPVIERW